MTETPRNPSESAAKRRTRSLWNGGVAGTAIAIAVIGGLAVGEAIFAKQGFAANAAETSPVTGQLPDFADLVEKVSPAVVSIRVREGSTQVSGEGDSEPFPGFRDLPPDMRRFFGQMPKKPRQEPQPTTALGSGFFISDDGYLVTNNHVVDNADNFTVTAEDGTEYHAKLIGKDDRTDLALLKVSSGKPFPYVKFSEDPIRVGQWVLAVGNPFGLGGTVTAGIVSATGREIGSGPYDNFIQIDAPINRGNSGGPTFNVKGEVIGINTSIYSPSGGSVGIAFAIPASTAEQVIASLRSEGKVVRGWLGIEIQSISSEIAASLSLQGSNGALVAQPQEDGPASKAGVAAGDAILAVDRKEVKDPRDLSMRIAAYPPGTTVTLTIWRDGQKRDLPVRLGSLPEAQKQAVAEPTKAKPPVGDGFGLSLAAAKKHDGVLITKVDPNGSAADSGLQEGDLIASVGNLKVATPDEFEKQVKAARDGGLKAVLLQVTNGKETRFVGLSLGSG
jgi:serine protease Do